MTQYTESDLRTVFDEYSGEGPRRPAYLDEIVRRGRGARLRRRVTAGAAALVGAAVAVGLAGVYGLSGSAPANVPASTVRVSNGVELPQEVDGTLGGRMTLIHSEARSTVGEGVKVTFRPTTLNTGISVRCADPEVWLLVRGPEGEADFGRCGQRRGAGLDSQYDWQSTPPEWLTEPQTIEVWLFPADAPIVWKAKPGDGKFDMDMITAHPERLARVVDHRPSEWAVGVYDKPVRKDHGITGG